MDLRGRHRAVYIISVAAELAGLVRNGLDVLAEHDLGETK